MPPLKILFICSRNRIRSLTAERILSGDDRYLVRSAGTADGARIRVTAGHIGWADFIFVMEPKHRDLLRRRFRSELHGKSVVCLFIPDEDSFEEEALIALLSERLSPLLEINRGSSASGP